MSRIEALLARRLVVAEDEVYPMRECRVEADFVAAFMVIAQTSPELSLDLFLQRAERARRGGWRLFAALLDGEPAAAVGFRLLEDIAWGRTLMVEQLVVDSGLRDRGVGTALMLRMADLGRLTRCDHVRAGVGAQRTSAHAFLEVIGMRQTSAGFAWALD